jgi:hypothetical protein
MAVSIAFEFSMKLSWTGEGTGGAEKDRRLRGGPSGGGSAEGTGESGGEYNGREELIGQEELTGRGWCPKSVQFTVSAVLPPQYNGQEELTGRADVR